MKHALLMPLLLLATTASYAQPSIRVGPPGVEVDPGVPFEPRGERIVRDEGGGCHVTIIRRFDEAGRHTTREIRECDDDEEDEE